VPQALRKIFVEAPVSLLPSSELKRSRFRDAKRFLKGADLPRTERYFRWMSTFNRDCKQGLYTPEFEASVAGQNSSSVLDEWFAKANGTGIVDAAMLTDQMTYLPNDLLVKVDIASMGKSLEARSPFLDHKLIEFAASLPENIKMRGFGTKSLLKKVAARLVPREVIYRPKMGFGVPMGKWFRGEMKDFMRGVLLSEKSLNRGIVRSEHIERYVNEHTDAKYDHSFQLWTLLMLELWFQRFIDPQ
jgi:asparagine synthase (glutamine-hydrolysing)